MEMIGAKRDPLSPRDKGEAPAQLEKMMPQMVNERLVSLYFEKDCCAFPNQETQVCVGFWESL
jgi:hypothetical protein